MALSVTSGPTPVTSPSEMPIIASHVNDCGLGQRGKRSKFELRTNVFSLILQNTFLQTLALLFQQSFLNFIRTSAMGLLCPVLVFHEHDEERLREFDDVAPVSPGLRPNAISASFAQHRAVRPAPVAALIPLAPWE